MPLPTTRSPGLDVDAVRAHFPALGQQVYDDRPLVYLDNAATTHKPQAVLDRLAAFYGQENSNIHRGVHWLSQQATDAYETARQAVARFIGAAHPHEVIFTRGTTESINLVASTYGRRHVQAGDAVVVSALEHHSNIVPWQMLCEERGAHLEVIPVDERGVLDQEAYRALLTDRVRLVAVNHISNALGTINPVAEMVETAHQHGIPVFVDGAQAAPHLKIDVQALDADFYALSAHKVFGPTGVGVLYGKETLLEAMPPYQGGGDMIERVTFEGTTFNELPHKFEAGTPHIAGGLGLAAAVEFVDEVGHEAIGAHEAALLAYANERLAAIPNVRLVGTAPQKASVVSFLIGDIHPYDAGTILDRLGVAVRTGHHCAQPLMDRLGVPGTVRASFALYNTTADVDALADGIERVQRLFG